MSKEGALVIDIGKGGSKAPLAEGSDDGDGADDESGGASEAAQDLIDALDSKDPESVTLAFRAMMKSC